MITSKSDKITVDIPMPLVIVINMEWVIDNDKKVAESKNLVNNVNVSKKPSVAEKEALA